MKNKEIFILMYKNLEIFSFSIDFNKGQTKLIKKLEHFERVPLTISKAEPDNIDGAIMRYINHRTIPPMRTDYEEIMKAVGCEDSVELSFKGHGLSLSDHYWYKREGENLRYEDINFFTNKWDDSFAKCMINHDYEGLKHCNLNVPDVVTPGWGTKGWIYEDDGPKLYKLGIYKDHSEESIGEVLASRIARRLFNDDEVVHYELRKVGDRYASVSPVIINIDEEMIPLYEYVPSRAHALYANRNTNKEVAKQFYDAIGEAGIPGLKEFFIKLACLKDLCFVSDLHFGNISLIKNDKTGQLRIAPVYDLGGAFGSSRSGQDLLLNANEGTIILIYYLFSDLWPDWDYSWYDKNRLIGVEDEIVEYLSKSDFYTPNLINSVLDVYHHQKRELDNMAENSNK